MDYEVMTKLITTVGFPIVCVIALGWFIYKFYTNEQQQQTALFNQLQADAKEREEKLYTEISENREVNKKAIETIAKYSEKLDDIQQDIHDIKSDISIMKAKEI